MRDHLLGCQAFLPPDPEDRTIHLRRRFPLGTPQRAKDQGLTYHRKLHAQEQAIDAFNTGDHTPPEMQADFPREYDLMTMLNEAANRPPKMWLDLAGPNSEITALAEFYDRELQRVCGISLNHFA